MTDALLNDDVVMAELDTDENTDGRGVNRFGYRGWSGELESGAMRWTVISAVGIRRAWQSRWLRRMLFFAWMPAVLFGIGFFVWEQAALFPEWQRPAMNFLGGLLPAPVAQKSESRFAEGTCRAVGTRSGRRCCRRCFAIRREC